MAPHCHQVVLLWMLHAYYDLVCCQQHVHPSHSIASQSMLFVSKGSCWPTFHELRPWLQASHDVHASQLDGLEDRLVNQELQGANELVCATSVRLLASQRTACAHAYAHCCPALHAAASSP